MNWGCITTPEPLWGKNDWCQTFMVKHFTRYQETESFIVSSFLNPQTQWEMEVDPFVSDARMHVYRHHVKGTTSGVLVNQHHCFHTDSCCTTGESWLANCPTSSTCITFQDNWQLLILAGRLACYTTNSVKALKKINYHQSTNTL